VNDETVPLRRDSVLVVHQEMGASAISFSDYMFLCSSYTAPVPPPPKAQNPHFSSNTDTPLRPPNKLQT
jgi:hypothetical protein